MFDKYLLQAHLGKHDANVRFWPTDDARTSWMPVLNRALKAQIRKSALRCCAHKSLGPASAMSSQ